MSDRYAPSTIAACIRAVRYGALLHPMPKEGEQMDGREFQTAEAYDMACMLADELEQTRKALAFADANVPLSYLQETASKRYNRVQIDFPKIVEIHTRLVNEFQKTGMRTVAILVLAAMTVRVYAQMANKPQADILRTITTFARQLAENRPLDSSEGA